MNFNTAFVEKLFVIKKNTEINIPKNALKKFIERNFPEFNKDLNKYWNADQETVSTKKVRKSISDGYIDPEWEKELIDNTDDYTNDIYYLFTLGLISKNGKWLTNKIGNATGQNLIFRDATKSILDFIDNNTLNYAKNLNTQKLQALRNILQKSLANSWTAAETSKIMFDSVPLTQNQAGWVANHYQKFLDAGNTKEVALKKTKRIANRYRRNRANLIANTEMPRIKSFSEIQAINQQIDKGKLFGASKTWRRNNDERNHQNSIDNDGETVSINANFSDGSPYPQELNEKCDMLYSVVT